MFENITSLSALNKERAALVKSGVPVMEINAAYNAAKKKLLEDAPRHRSIPVFSAPTPSIGKFKNLLGLRVNVVPTNEIRITAEGVLM